MKYTKSKLVGMGTLFFSPEVPEIDSWDGLFFDCDFGGGGFRVVAFRVGGTPEGGACILLS